MCCKVKHLIAQRVSKNREKSIDIGVARPESLRVMVDAIA